MGEHGNEKKVIRPGTGERFSIIRPGTSSVPGFQDPDTHSQTCNRGKTICDIHAKALRHGTPAEQVTSNKYHDNTILILCCNYCKNPD
jgi:hypothetical protein